MPLYVTNGKLQLGEPGKLAAQRACCCDEEGDNPEDCVCPDVCLYRIEVVAPLAFGPRPAVPCTEDSNNSLTDQTPLDLGPCNAHWPNEGVTSFAGKIGQSLIAQAAYLGQNLQSPGAIASVSVNCSGEKLVAVILWAIAVPGAVLNIYYGLPYRLLYRIATVELPSACSRKSNATCVTGIPSVRGNFLSTPLEFTVSNETPGIGDWGSPYVDDQFGDQTNITDCFEHLQENFSATFRITQRESCQPVDCNCGVDLFTMKALFDGKEFTVGEEYDHVEVDGDIEEYWSHYESAGIYYFVYERWLGPGKQILYERRAATLFCDNDEESSPTVQRWYVEFEMKCRTYDGNFSLIEETTKTEIGYFVCGLGEFCGGLAADQPVPLGSPIEIEEVPGSPATTNGLDPCTPPARPSLTLSCQ